MRMTFIRKDNTGFYCDVPSPPPPNYSVPETYEFSDWPATPTNSYDAIRVPRRDFELVQFRVHGVPRFVYFEV